jgi:hypothetical protein
MDLLQQGVEQSVIALWLGHESIETTILGWCCPWYSLLQHHPLLPAEIYGRDLCS